MKGSVCACVRLLSLVLYVEVTPVSNRISADTKADLILKAHFLDISCVAQRSVEEGKVTPQALAGALEGERRRSDCRSGGCRRQPSRAHFCKLASKVDELHLLSFELNYG